MKQTNSCFACFSIFGQFNGLWLCCCTFEKGGPLAPAGVCGGGKEGCCYLNEQAEDLQVNHSEATFTFSFQTLNGDFGKRSFINDRLGVFASFLHIFVPNPSY